jgi:hypothetical protein
MKGNCYGDFLSGSITKHISDPVAIRNKQLSTSKIQLENFKNIMLNPINKNSYNFAKTQADILIKQIEGLEKILKNNPNQPLQ